jgi:hypothetical protein
MLEMKLSRYILEKFVFVLPRKPLKYGGAQAGFRIERWGLVAQECKVQILQK